MKYGLLIILTLATAFQSTGQDIEYIVFTTQQIDEPPTKEGRPLYTIEFKRHNTGDFVVSTYLEDARKRKLTDTITIDKAQVDKVKLWITSNKTSFNQIDLGLSVKSIKNKTSDYKLNFEIPDELVVRIDSFQFCQTYKMTQTISTGGEIIAVTLIYRSEKKDEFAFDSNEIGGRELKLRDYILCYTLLKDKIPREIRNYDFFTSDKLADILLYYQKTVECEGYYYQEYIDKHPKLTSKEKRMMTGWNFVKYMRQRNNK